MAHHIMGFNVSEIRRLLESRNFPIQMFQPRVDFGITIINHVLQSEILVSNSPDIALEMLYVDRIEPDDGDV